MHESSTPQDSSEKPNWIQITHRAISIFLLHVRRDKVSLSKQMTNCPEILDSYRKSLLKSRVTSNRASALKIRRLADASKPESVCFFFSKPPQLTTDY